MFAEKKKKELLWHITLEEKNLDKKLREAAIAGDLEALKQLVTAGASYHSKDTIYGRSVLSWTQNYEVAQYLLKLGVSVNMTDYLKQTALHRAVINSASVELVKLLIESRIDPNMEDLTGLTALEWSTQVNNTKLGEILEKVTKKKPPKEHVVKPPAKPSAEPEKKKHVQEKSSGYSITESDAIDIARGIPKTTEKVRFLAIDYNWGPPVSGRYDRDFLQLWAIARSSAQPKLVLLVGAYLGDKNWNAEVPFVYVQKVDKDYDLYLLKLENRIPLEFVIKLECMDGSVHYDNNGGIGVNYKLVPFQGRWTSAHTGIDHIQIYSNFVRCQFIPKTPD